MLTFRRVFSRRIFSMRKPRPALAALVSSRQKKYPAGSEPAGLYIINKGGFAGRPATREMLPARNKYEKSIIAAAGKFLSLFFAYVFCISCFCVLLCVAVRGGSCCLCNGAVVSSRLLHMRLFQPHIYNMTNLSKNKNHFF